MNAHLNFLRPYLRRYRGYLLIGCACVLIHNGLGLIVPMVMRQVVDLLGSEVASLTIWAYAGAIVGLTLVSGIFLFLMRRTIIWASRKMEFDLRGDLFGHLLSLSPSYFDKTPTGEILSRASSDIDAVRMMLGPGIMYTVNTVIVSAGAIPFMIYLDWRLALYTLLPLPILSLIVNRVGSLVHHRFRAIQEQFAVLSAHAQESLAGIRVVKSGAHEDIRNNEFAKLNDTYFELNMRLIRVQAMFRPLLMFLAGGAVVAVLYFGGNSVIEGRISLGTFVAFTLYLAMLIWPMIALGWVVSIYQRGSASLGRIRQVFEQASDVVDSKTITIPDQLTAEIEFRKLSFAYPGTEREVLRELSFKVPPGETLALLGATGSGKTTLLRLLGRAYPVPDESIFIGGIDINRIPLVRLRRMLGIVAQESFLFSSTLAENIGFGLSATPDEEKLNQLARAAGIAAEIDQLPHRWQTIIGERGITLSGGQKQRVSLARALAIDTPFLILDDAFSSVDTQTEENILDYFDEGIASRTVLMVSHRISTARRADRIAVLDNGRIAESGTHEQLLAAGGPYADLAEKQVLREQLETI